MIFVFKIDEQMKIDFTTLVSSYTNVIRLPAFLWCSGDDSGVYSELFDRSMKPDGIIFDIIANISGYGALA